MPLGLIRYLAHNPSSLGFQTAVALALHALDLTLVVVAAAGLAALGRRALGRKAGWRTWLFGLVLGETALGLFLWALLAAGLLRFPIAASLWLLLALVAWLERRELKTLLPKRPSTALDWACAAALAIALFCGAAAAGAPPTDWDTLVNHFGAPKIYLALGTFERLPWMLGAHYPFTAEMQYGWLMTLRAAETAQWWAWLHGVLLCAAAGAWSGGWACAALVAAAEPMSRLLGTGKNDMQAALAVFAALLAFETGADWLLIGLLAGAAAAVKFNGLWALAALGLLSLGKPRDAARFTLGALLGGSAWYLRTWYWTGSPVWPMFGWGAGAASVFTRLRGSITSGIPFPPLALLAAAALSALLLRRRPTTRLTFFAAAYALTWAVCVREGRFLLPLLPLFAAVAAAAPKPGRYVVLALGFFPVLTLSANNELFGFLALSPQHSAVDARRRYLLHSLGAPYALAEAANALPPTAKLALYRDPRGFYLDRDYAVLDPIVTPHDALPNVAALRSYLKGRGFTHLLYNPTLGPVQGDDAYYARVDGLYAELVARRTPLATAGPLALFALE